MHWSNPLVYALAGAGQTHVLWWRRLRWLLKDVRYQRKKKGAFSTLYCSTHQFCLRQCRPDAVHTVRCGGGVASLEPFQTSWSDTPASYAYFICRGASRPVAATPRLPAPPYTNATDTQTPSNRESRTQHTVSPQAHY